MRRPVEALLTLEPLIEAVATGVESAGWALSGMQKTTSHQFEGRWEGESSRSAYLFFHPRAGREHVSIDVFLDETSQGLAGNLALVLEGRPLPELGAVDEALVSLRTISSATLPAGYRAPLTLRFRVEGRSGGAADAESEIRFKLRIPRKSIEAGKQAVTDLAHATVRAFEALLADPGLAAYVPDP